MTAYFTGVITVSMLYKANVEHARQRLDYAIQFYLNGFCLILTAMGPGDSARTALGNDPTPFTWVDFLKSVAVDLLWTVIFWALAISGLWPNVLA
jgi:hypothetical protein